MQVLANALIPLLAALALVPITAGADMPLAAESSARVVRLLGVFLGAPPDLQALTVSYATGLKQRVVNLTLALNPNPAIVSALLSTLTATSQHSWVL